MEKWLVVVILKFDTLSLNAAKHFFFETSWTGTRTQTLCRSVMTLTIEPTPEVSKIFWCQNKSCAELPSEGDSNPR